jgi:hypothetical protein
MLLQYNNLARDQELLWTVFHNFESRNVFYELNCCFIAHSKQFSAALMSGIYDQN